MSQHETLKRLAEIANTQVYYACPMIFADEDVLERPVDLSKLRFVDVRTSPQGWNTNDNHYIAFRTKLDSSPMWCSKPVQATSIGIQEWLLALNVPSALMHSQQTADFLAKSRGAFLGESPYRRGSRVPEYPAQLTLIEFAPELE